MKVQVIPGKRAPGEWIRFEDARTRNGGEFGTILKDGRLLIGNALAQSTGIVPGTFVEIFYKPDCQMLAFKPSPERTPYSYGVISTGPKDHPFGQPLVGEKRLRREVTIGGRKVRRAIGPKVEKADRSLPAAVVSLKGFLNSRHIGMSSRVRGKLYWDAVIQMLVFEIPEESITLVQPSEHVAGQLKNNSWPERVIGDSGIAQPTVKPTDKRLRENKKTREQAP